ncbi:ABC transporter substrate-binding protein [Neomegalonema sp.]|uniref:ABC transporter substrate-binding protein n=1 Tax=Neomegalonema sp. TaxID=2039713 RepID=UPI0026376D04|nr:ABC transporter substrate-binding protein [Neomegalonema sp.]MDD2868462.1 ABC transporter substrate-binding protein [Neomegalonema sp.]
MRRLLALLLAFGASPGPAGAQDFPRRFAHLYGETILEAPPERVVSLGYVGHDHLLALGVVPVALRYWYGPYASGVWPWAAPLLGEARPVVLRGELSFERIALLEPDLILAVSSGIGAQDHRMLSRIAPVVASEAEYGDFNTPWEVQLATIGRAVGREARARELTDDIHARMQEIRAAHPEWSGMTAVAASIFGGEPAVFLPGDARADLLTSMGFQTPPALEAHRGEGFFLPLSAEDLAPLDADLLLWVGGTPGGEALAALKLRPGMRAAREGREIWADEIMAGALGHATPLSLPFVLERLPAEIEAAVDGDPATKVPSAVAAGIAP